MDLSYKEKESQFYGELRLFDGRGSRNLDGDKVDDLARSLLLENLKQFFQATQDCALRDVQEVLHDIIEWEAAFSRVTAGRLRHSLNWMPVRTESVARSAGARANTGSKKRARPGSRKGRQK